MFNILSNYNIITIIFSIMGTVIIVPTSILSIISIINKKELGNLRYCGSLSVYCFLVAVFFAILEKKTTMQKDEFNSMVQIYSNTATRVLPLVLLLTTLISASFIIIHIKKATTTYKKQKTYTKKPIIISSLATIILIVCTVIAFIFA